MYWLYEAVPGLDYLLGCRLDLPVCKEQLAIIDRVEAHLSYGRLEGWYPDSGMYLDIFQLLCTDPKKSVAAEQLMWEDLVVGTFSCIASTRRLITTHRRASQSRHTPCGSM